VAVFAMSAVAAASAAAAPKWEARHCLNVGENKGKFENSECIKEGGKKEFEWGAWAVLTATEKVTSSGTLKLTDEGTGVTLTCEGTDEGTVGPEGKDETTKITATKCTSSNKSLCPEPATATALNLPWQTALEEPEAGKIRDKITTTAGTKEVGWEVKCNNGITDKCLAASSSTGMKNNEANGTVAAAFDAKTPKANCSIGGAAKGKVEGTVTNKAGKSWQIRVK
jgi:hypothetical protein